MKIKLSLLSISLAFSTSLFAQESAQEASPENKLAASKDEAQASVVISSMKNPALKPYRIMAVGMETYEEYKALAPEAPLYYIKANWIKPGQVQQARIVGNEEFEFANARFKLNHRCTNSLDANNLKSCKVTFSDGKKEQFIANTKESPNGKLNDSASTVTVVWAGDIDRDGKIDLILSSSFENGESTQLFLSSQATHQELAKAVAIVTRLGC